MKKILVLLLLSIPTLTIAQWLGPGATIGSGEMYYNGGNVGIGSTTPNSKLFIKHGASSDGVKILTDDGGENTAKLQVLFNYNSSSANRNAVIELGRDINDSGSYKWRLLANSGHTWGNMSTFSIQNLIGGVYNTRLKIANDGNVGIGTAEPSCKLQIQGSYDGLFTALKLVNSQGSGSIYTSVGIDFHHFGNVAPNARIYEKEDGWSGTYGGSLVFSTRTHGGDASSTSLLDRMVVKYNGNVGIGNTNPTEKLVVDGKILAEEIKVQAVPSSDYVFEPDYHLRSLSEVDQFIQENKHLPDIPSSKEFKENGVGLGEMDDMLLRKVEELTLYVIELKKENEELKEIVIQQNYRIKNIEENE